MKLKTVLVSLFVFFAACTPESDPKPPGADGGVWDLGDPRPDAGGGDDQGGFLDIGGGGDGGDHDAGGGEDMGPPTRDVVFRLENTSGAPVFAYNRVAGDASCEPGFWLEVAQDGVRQKIGSDCSACSCAEPECAVCAFDCAPGVQVDYAQLAPGEAREFTWDGLFRMGEERDTGYCEVLEEPTGALTATFCWADAFVTDEFGPFGELAEESCTEVEFERTDGLVEVVIPELVQRTITFEMKNATGTDLYAHTDGGTSFCDTGVWLQLAQENPYSDGPELLRTYEDCNVCSCVEVAQEGVQTCNPACPAIGCPAPTIEAFEFPAGSSRSFTWSVTHFGLGDVGGERCERELRPSDRVTAQFCWATGATNGLPATLQDVECEAVEFDPYDTESVVYEVTTTTP